MARSRTWRRGNTGIHEDITAEALGAEFPSAGRLFRVQLQTGVENTDITHQFDEESHFANASAALGRGSARASRASRSAWRPRVAMPGETPG